MKVALLLRVVSQISAKCEIPIQNPKFLIKKSPIALFLSFHERCTYVTTET